MKLMEIKTDYKIFLDMDGVFADFSGGIEKIFPEPHSEEKYETDPKYKKEMWKKIGEYQKEGGELWYGLDMMSDGQELWDYVKKHNPTFLSATGRSRHKETADEKRRWLDDKFGNVPAIFVKAAAEKHKEADKHHILIDDKMKAIDPWVNAGGIGILHTSAEETIRRLKDLGL